MKSLELLKDNPLVQDYASVKKDERLYNYLKTHEDQKTLLMLVDVADKIVNGAIVS